MEPRSHQELREKGDSAPEPEKEEGSTKTTNNREYDGTDKRTAEHY
jgi:hypothetical protein